MITQTDKANVRNAVQSLKGISTRLDGKLKLDMLYEIERIGKTFKDLVGRSDQIINYIARSKDEALALGLQAPLEFWAMAPADMAAIIGRGGCGPGRIGDKFIPDTILGLSVLLACMIHDFEYYFLTIAKMTPDERKAKRLEIDTRFLNNMKAIVEKRSSWALRHLRLRIVNGFYLGVRIGGVGY